ncbi:DUF2938 domain-containing protein [Achromobacter sp. UMC46]|uniref:DUF2938 domain-containing protein n=1 Tax=Achromobacter sp. UMC46 TaxID=1862319 RepID=UPI0015FF8774|nr:DUF2938 domain-containing protein [Achromobacter sp. UMC46]MBB1598069.1 hypothetical protein [Achromobacter sp. UMC46]
MNPAVLEFIQCAVLIGVGATLVMDLWAIVIKRCFGIPSLNFAMVGRWIGHLPRGRFRHENMARSAPVRGEAWLGWGAHYAIGIVFAAMLLAVVGIPWTLRPTLAPALLFGILSVAAPFFILQPGMGAGIAASKTPRPNTARLRSLMAHAVFGVGLYVTTWTLMHFYGG